MVALQLNITRFGDNLIYDLDQDLSDLEKGITGHLVRRDLSPGLPARTPSPILSGPITEIPATTPSPTLAPRGVRSELSDMTSDIGSHASDIKSDASSLTSEVVSDYSSETSKVVSAYSSETSKIVSEATSAIGALPSELTNELNKEFMRLKQDVGLYDWYSVHLIDYCWGFYSPNISDVANATVYGIPAPVHPGQKVTKQVVNCDKRSTLSDFDPKTAVLVLYWIAVIFIGLSLILSSISAFRFGWVGPFINIFISLIGFFFIALGSALTTGFSAEAAKLIDALGKDFGISAYKGENFFKLTWTATALMLLNVIIWAWEFEHRFKNDFRQHLRPIWNGFKGGMTRRKAATGTYEKEQYGGTGDPYLDGSP